MEAMDAAYESKLAELQEIPLDEAVTLREKLIRDREWIDAQIAMFQTVLWSRYQRDEISVDEYMGRRRT